MAADEDPFSPTNLRDPHPLYTRLRASGGPVHLASRDVWLVARYAEAVAVLRDPATFQSGLGTSYNAALELRGALIDSDPPDHTRVRRMVQRWFTPRAIDE